MRIKFAVSIDLPKDDSLLARTIRLAYGNESLRPHLMPLITKEARDIGRTDLQNLHQKKGSFVIVSAYRGDMSKKENKIRHGEMLADLQRMGYRNWKDASGYWGYREKSVIVPRMSYKEGVHIGEKYDQDAIIYKHDDGVIGMYDLKGRSVQIAAPEVDFYTDDEGVTEFRNVSMSYDFIDGLTLPLTGGPITTAYLERQGLMEEYPQLQLL